MNGHTYEHGNGQISTKALSGIAVIDMIWYKLMYGVVQFDNYEFIFAPKIRGKYRIL